jgi:hypothetical protein
MNGATVEKFLDDLSYIGGTNGNENEIVIQTIIDKMLMYSACDLRFLKDCIEFMIIYKKHHKT